MLLEMLDSKQMISKKLVKYLFNFSIKNWVLIEVFRKSRIDTFVYKETYITIRTGNHIRFWYDVGIPHHAVGMV